MTREEALKTLEENICNTCDYGSPNMESCDIRYCDNREAIEVLKQETKESKDIHLPLYKVNDRIEYGTDGNLYKLSMSNGKEYEKQDYEYDKRILSRRYGNVFACNNCGRRWFACKDDILEGYEPDVKIRCPYCHNMINIPRNYDWD